MLIEPTIETADIPCPREATRTVRLILGPVLDVCDEHAKHLGFCDHYPCICEKASASSVWCSWHSVRQCLWCGGVLSAPPTSLG